jgi:hypothetical protein
MAASQPECKLFLTHVALADQGDGYAEHTWRIENQGSEPVLVSDSWLPHGGFRAERRDFTPPLLVPPSDSATFSRRVYCAAGPGESVENAFLIVSAGPAGREWRVFFRLRIDRSAEGRIEVTVEKTTAQAIEDRAASAAGSSVPARKGEA